MKKYLYPYVIVSYILPWIFLSVYLAGCSSQEDQSAALRLGYLQNDLHHLPVFVALEKSFFDKRGISIRVAGIFRAGPELMSAFAAHELDIGYVGQAPATAAVLNGIADVKFIAQVNLEGSSIVVKKESSYKKLSHLEGKTVAIPGHATMQDFLFRKAVKKSNVSIDKIKLIVLKPPEMIQALSLGSIDAFIAWEPYPSQAVRRRIGRSLVTSDEIWADHPCCVLVADTKLCNQFPDIVKTIRTIHRESCNFIIKNPDEAIEIGMKYTGMDKETISMAVSKIKYSPVIDRIKEFEFVDFLKKLRYIKPQKQVKPLPDIFYD